MSASTMGSRLGVENVLTIAAQDIQVGAVGEQADVTVGADERETVVTQTVVMTDGVRRASERVGGSLVDTSDSYTGSVPMPAGPAIVAVTADGD